MKDAGDEAGSLLDESRCRRGALLQDFAAPGRDAAGNAIGCFAFLRLRPANLILCFCLALSACGFQLRGQQTLPFETLYIAGDPSSTFIAEMQRFVRGGTGTEIVDRPEDAEAILQIFNEVREKTILSLSGAGRVREFEIRYRVLFSLRDAKENILIPNGEIVLDRDYTFNDTQVLAKEQEEAALFRDMQTDAVRQLLRRLRAVDGPSAAPGKG
ncbi:MAG: hypothetical protein H0V78_01390 [Burkholderiales bacterium]|nr:hypothetical protein [Burkholderiales bacterium]